MEWSLPLKVWARRLYAPYAPNAPGETLPQVLALKPFYKSRKISFSFKIILEIGAFS